MANGGWIVRRPFCEDRAWISSVNQREVFLQFVIPVLLGVFIGYVTSFTSLVGGLIAGLAVAAATWGAFFWRPKYGGQVSPPGAPTAAVVSPAGSDSPLTPKEVGTVLAGSLDYTCRTDDLSPEIGSVIEAAGVSDNRYRMEWLVLAGFASDYAVWAMLKNHPSQAEVQASYRNAWASLGERDAAGATLYKLYLDRCSAYAEGVQKQGEFMQGIGAVFSESLGVTEGAPLLSVSVLGDSLFNAQLEGVQNLLKKAKLLPA